MKCVKFLITLGIFLIIGSELCFTYRVRHKKRREMPKINDLKTEYLTQNTAKYIMGENLDKSDIEVNPNRYIILNGMDEEHDPQMKRGTVYDKDKAAYYPYINPDKHETVSVPELSIPKERYTNKIYPLDRNPYYGQTQDFRYIMNLPKDKIAVPVEFGDLTRTHSDPMNLYKMEKELAEIDKPESINDISLSGKYITDSKAYYDPTIIEKNLKKTELQKSIENMKEDLLHPHIPHFEFEKIDADPRVQNWINSNREETNEFIANSYHYPVVKNSKGYDVAGPVGNSESSIQIESSKPEFPEGHYRTYEQLVKDGSVLGVEYKADKPSSRVLPPNYVEGTPAQTKKLRTNPSTGPSSNSIQSTTKNYTEADDSNKIETEAESVGEKLGSKYINEKNEPAVKINYIEADTLSKKIVEADVLGSTSKKDSPPKRIIPQTVENIFLNENLQNKSGIKKDKVINNINGVGPMKINVEIEKNGKSNVEFVPGFKISQTTENSGTDNMLQLLKKKNESISTDNSINSKIENNQKREENQTTNNSANEFKFSFDNENLRKPNLRQRNNEASSNSEILKLKSSLENPSVQRMKELESSSIETSKESGIPSVQSVKELESPTIQRMKELETPTIQKEFETPTIQRMKELETPTIQITKEFESPSIQRMKELETPIIQTTKEFENPTIQTTKEYENPTILTSKEFESPSIQRMKELETPTIERTTKKEIESPTIQTTREQEYPTIQTKKEQENETIKNTKEIETLTTQTTRELESPIIQKSKEIDRTSIQTAKEIENPIIQATKEAENSSTQRMKEIDIKFEDVKIVPKLGQEIRLETGYQDLKNQEDFQNSYYN